MRRQAHELQRRFNARVAPGDHLAQPARRQCRPRPALRAQPDGTSTHEVLDQRGKLDVRRRAIPFGTDL